MGIKTCGKCKQDKSYDQFYKGKKSCTNLSSYCKECDKARIRTRDRQSYRLQILYGLTKEEYDEMVVLQCGTCYICALVPERKLFVDHCHTTGKVRGLLCHKCNSALGYLNDDVKALERAIQYVK